MKKSSTLLIAATTGLAMVVFAPPPTTAAPGPEAVARAASGTPMAVNGTRTKVRLKQGIRKIRQRAQHPRGYVRSKFKTWDDANRDCQDTRSEVLRQESRKRVTGRCAVERGLWVSPYDHVRFRDASGLDIDHLVPLAEAWRSGARAWSAAKREAYANDLAFRRSLVAVSAHSNRSKGDRDPSRWMPAYGKCAYVKSWVAVKLRWRLSADRAEKRALRRIASGCTNSRITVPKAAVRNPRGSTGGGGKHGCTRTSTGSCITGGSFCPQASYGDVGYDAHGNRYTCTGDRTHPHWS